ncbi:hypothetical protein BKA80DRAFT_15795 [Phyllosticta citrichinensis]
MRTDWHSIYGSAIDLVLSLVSNELELNKREPSLEEYAKYLMTHGTRVRQPDASRGRSYCQIINKWKNQRWQCGGQVGLARPAVGEVRLISCSVQIDAIERNGLATHTLWRCGKRPYPLLYRGPGGLLNARARLPEKRRARSRYMDTAKQRRCDEAQAREGTNV